MQGTWETWLEFFLKGILYSANEAIQTTQNTNTLFSDDQKKIDILRRIKHSCTAVLDSFKHLPQSSVLYLSQTLSPPTVRSALNHLVALRVLEQISGKIRDKVYVYRRYLDLLEDGAEPFP